MSCNEETLREALRLLETQLEDSKSYARNLFIVCLLLLYYSFIHLPNFYKEKEERAIAINLESVISKLDSLKDQKNLILNILSEKFENIVFSGNIQNYIKDLGVHFGELAMTQRKADNKEIDENEANSLNTKSIIEFNEKFISYLDEQQIVTQAQKRAENKIETIFSSILQVQKQLLLNKTTDELNDAIAEMKNTISDQFRGALKLKVDEYAEQYALISKSINEKIQSMQDNGEILEPNQNSSNNVQGIQLFQEERLVNYSLKISLILTIFCVILPLLLVFGVFYYYNFDRTLNELLFLERDGKILELIMWLALMITFMDHELLKRIDQLNRDYTSKVCYHLLKPFAYIIQPLIYFIFPSFRICFLFLYDGKARFLLAIISIFLGQTLLKYLIT